MTNRLRTEATDHSGRRARHGSAAFRAQSFGAFRWARTGGPVPTEADPLVPDPPAALGTAQEGYLYLEEAVTRIDWAMAWHCDMAAQAGDLGQPGRGCGVRGADPQAAVPDRRRRRRRLVHIHIEDAAAATAVAVERGQPVSTTLSMTSPRE